MTPSHNDTPLRDATVAPKPLSSLRATGLLAVIGIAGILEPRAVLASAFLLLAAAFVSVVLKKPDYGVLAMIFASALDVMGRLGSAGGVSLTVYQVAAAGMFVVLAVRMRMGLTKLKAGALDVPVLLFMLVVAASLPGAFDFKLAFVSLFKLASSVFLMYAVFAFIDDHEKARHAAWGLLVFGGIFGFLALVEWRGIFAVQGSFLKIWGYGIRARVTFEDPNSLGHFLAVASALGIPLAWYERRWYRLVAWAAVAFALAGLFVTFSRGAWLSILTSSLVILLFLRIATWKKVAVAVTVAALALGAVVFLVSPVVVQTKIVGIAQDNSALIRVRMAGSALRVSQDYPMGVGIGNYPSVYSRYRDAAVRANLVESHMTYLTLLVEIGLLGLVPFLWILWRAGMGLTKAVGLAKQAYPLALGALAALAGTFMQSLTYSLEASKFLWFILGLALVLARLTAEEGERPALEGEEIAA